MSFRLSVSDQHLQHEEEQSYAHEIHELLVKFFEYYRTVLLIFHPADVVNLSREYYK